MEYPLVSVVIPSYNHEKYIEQALASVFCQDYPSMQVIVIDDGSTDGSAELLKKLQNRWDFELIVQENQGLVTTLNASLKLVKGKYLCALASDDIWLSHDRLKCQVHFMENNSDHAMVCGHHIPINQQGETFVGQHKFSEALDISLNAELRGNLVFASTVMLKTDSVRQIGGWDPDIWMEDYALWLKLLVAGWKAKRLPRLMAGYRIHGANTSLGLRRMAKAEVMCLMRYAPAESKESVLRHYFQSQIEKIWRQDPLLVRFCLSQLGPRRFSKNLRRLYLHWLKKGQWQLLAWGLFGVAYQDFEQLPE